MNLICKNGSIDLNATFNRTKQVRNSKEKSQRQKYFPFSRVEHLTIRKIVQFLPVHYKKISTIMYKKYVFEKKTFL